MPGWMSDTKSQVPFHSGTFFVFVSFPFALVVSGSCDAKHHEKEDLWFQVILFIYKERPPPVTQAALQISLKDDLKECYASLK